MKQMMILGIANTGLAVVKQKPVGYSLIAAETIKTRPRDETGKRLVLIDDEINTTLDAWNITGIAIERVFHNYNVTSSLTTGAVIGILHFIAHRGRCIVCALWLPTGKDGSAMMGDVFFMTEEKNL